MPSPKFLECQFLIPVCRDAEIADGETHELESWQWLENQLLAQFSGWSKASELFQGAWRSSASGKVTHDTSIRYFAAVHKSKLNDLRGILKLACIEFGKQCIYLSVAGVVEFVEADG
jgi:hypothetical protein